MYHIKFAAKIQLLRHICKFKPHFLRFIFVFKPHGTKKGCKMQPFTLYSRLHPVRIAEIYVPYESGLECGCATLRSAMTTTWRCTVTTTSLYIPHHLMCINRDNFYRRYVIRFFLSHKARLFHSLKNSCKGTAFF